jgi:hypothetical protein
MPINHYVIQENGQLSHHCFEPLNQSYGHSLNLLLKPGHYDILYTQDDIGVDQYNFECGSFGNSQYAKAPKIMSLEITAEWVCEKCQ